MREWTARGEIAGTFEQLLNIYGQDLTTGRGRRPAGGVVSPSVFSTQQNKKPVGGGGVEPPGKTAPGSVNSGCGVVCTPSQNISTKVDPILLDVRIIPLYL